MARLERTQHSPQFLDSGDFNEQLYQALKKSPWWMVSIAVHGLLYAISTFVAPDEQPFSKSETVATNMAPADPPPDVEMPPSIEDETEKVHADDIEAREPTVRDAELSDHNETDNDIPDSHEMLGEGGISDAPFEGPANNATIGIGGGAGGAFKGRGGSQNLRTGGRGHGRADDALEDALRWLAAHQSSD